MSSIYNLHLFIVVGHIPMALDELIVLIHFRNSPHWLFPASAVLGAVHAPLKPGSLTYHNVDR